MQTDKQLYILTIKSKSNNVELILLVYIEDSDNVNIINNKSQSFPTNKKLYIIHKIINNYNLRHPFQNSGIYTIEFVEDYCINNNYSIKIEKYFTANWNY